MTSEAVSLSESLVAHVAGKSFRNAALVLEVTAQMAFILIFTSAIIRTNPSVQRVRIVENRIDG
jgi:hypothetical protein